MFSSVSLQWLLVHCTDQITAQTDTVFYNSGCNSINDESDQQTLYFRGHQDQLLFSRGYAGDGDHPRGEQHWPPEPDPTPDVQSSTGWWYSHFEQVREEK